MSALDRSRHWNEDLGTEAGDSTLRRRGRPPQHPSLRRPSDGIPDARPKEDRRQPAQADVGKLAVVYQPVVDTRSGRLVGAEALVRWHHPELGLVMPGTFIPIAEESGLIVPIGRWVLGTACRQARAWALAGHGELRLSVNVSGLELREQDYVDAVAAVLAETGMTPGLLELELTESCVMADDEVTRQTLAKLRALGVSLAIDGFGDRCSAFGNLHQFQVDCLKVDRSFVAGINRDHEDAATTRAILSLSLDLFSRVSAEGVETTVQMHFLRENGCHEVQGMLFGMPMSFDEFEDLLEKRVGAENGCTSRGPAGAGPRACAPPRKSLRSTG